MYATNPTSIYVKHTWIHSKVPRHIKNLEYTTHIQRKQTNQCTKRQNYMIISKDTERKSALDKVEHIYNITLRKLGRENNFLNLLKVPSKNIELTLNLMVKD